MSSRQDDEEPRRYLIAATVAEYLTNPAVWNRPGLTEARERIVSVFTGQLGYRLDDCVPPNPTRQQLTDALRAFCRSPERRDNDLVTVYLSCHGELLDDGGEHVLLTADADPEDLTYTALPTAELARTILQGTQVQRVMLLLDACYIGQGSNQLVSAAMERLGEAWGRTSGSGVVVISSAQPHQQAVAGLFPRLLDAAVTDLSVAGHGPAVLPVNAVVQHINASGDRPAYQRVSLAMVGDGELAFFPNPRHDVRLNEVDLALQQEAAFDEQDRRRETEFVTRLLVRAMGHQGLEDSEIPTTGWWFTGRHSTLIDLASWLNTADCDDTWACRVVTAAPGSGKTAVLGLIAALTHRERHRTVPGLGLPQDLLTAGAVDAAIYAQRLTDADVLDALCAAARVRATTVGELLDALDDRPRPLTVLIDALDEAATPDSLCTTILRPLIRHSRGRLRLLLGSRPFLLPHLGLGPAQVVDLDSDRYADPQALAVYAARTLLQAHPDSPYRDHPVAVRPVAQAVAEAAGHSFLIARITAGTLAATPTLPDPADPLWRSALPRHASEAMRRDLQERLGVHAQRAMDLLRPLAYAQGQGLPWEDIWARLAGEISGIPYTDDDLLWLRRAAGSYIVEATENGRSAYRLYHEAMAEHLRENTETQAVHSAYTRVLTDQIPIRADGTREWSRAHPYALRHLAHHAAQAGLLDQVLSHADYLVHAAPRGLTPHLYRAREDSARLRAAVYRSGVHLHQAVPPLKRRQVLALEAARAGARQLHQELVRGIPSGDWAPVWATGSTFDPALRDVLAGHTDSVTAVACTVVGDMPVAVTGGMDGSVRLWNLTAGTPVGEALADDLRYVNAVACTVVGDMPVAVAGGMDGSVRMWNLTTGLMLGQPFTDHTGTVEALACTLLNQRPVAVVVTGTSERSVRVWDLTSRQPIGAPLDLGAVTAVACTILEDAPVIVAGGMDGSLRVWDLAAGRLLGTYVTDYADHVESVACVSLQGRAAALTSGRDGSIQVWDLATGRPVRKLLTNSRHTVFAVACTDLDGAPVAVAGSWEGSVHRWDVATGQPLGEPLAHHTDRVFAAACTVLGEVPVAVTGGRDGTVRVWDLAASHTLGEPSVGHTRAVSAVAHSNIAGQPVAVSGSADGTVRMWDLETGTPVGEPLTEIGSVTSLACADANGVPLAVVGGRAAGVWDLSTGRKLLELAEDYPALAVACATSGDRPLALTGKETRWEPHLGDSILQLWDLATLRAASEPLIIRSGSVNKVACTAVNGHVVAIATGIRATTHVWHPTGDELIAELPAVDALAELACADLDGTPIALSGGQSGIVHIWDLTTCQLIGRPLIVHSGPVQSIEGAVLDGKPVVVTTSQDQTVHLWDLRARATITTLPVDAPHAATITDNGELIIGFHNDIALLRRLPHDRTTLP